MKASPSCIFSRATLIVSLAAAVSCSKESQKTNSSSNADRQTEAPGHSESGDASSRVDDASGEQEITIPPNVDGLDSQARWAAAQTTVQDAIARGGAGNVDKKTISNRAIGLWKSVAAELKQIRMDGAAGKNELPAQIDRKLQGIEFVDSIHSHIPSIPDRGDLQYKVTVMYSAALVAASFDAEQLLPMLTSVGTDGAGSALDIVGYYALRDAIGEIGSGASQARPLLTDFEKYEASDSPVARLLAIKAIAKSMPDRETQVPTDEEAAQAINSRRLDVLARFAGEPVPAIADELVDVVFTIGGERREEVLKRIASEQIALGNGAVVGKINRLPGKR